MLPSFVIAEMRSCTDPGVPANGYRLGTKFLPGQLITYVCNMGYTLVGEDKILCQPDGEWTQNRPLCKYLSFVDVDNSSNSNYSKSSG